MASTFSIAAVFIPVAYMKGMIGQFLFEFGAHDVFETRFDYGGLLQDPDRDARLGACLELLDTVDELMEGYRRGDPDSFTRDTVDSAIYRHYHALRLAGEREYPLDPLPVPRAGEADLGDVLLVQAGQDGDGDQQRCVRV